MKLKKWAHSMCRLGRARREKDEEKEREGVVGGETKEARKWDEKPSGEGNGDNWRPYYLPKPYLRSSLQTS